MHDEFFEGCMAQRPRTTMFWTRNEYHTHNSHQRSCCVSYKKLKRESSGRIKPMSLSNFYRHMIIYLHFIFKIYYVSFRVIQNIADSRPKVRYLVAVDDSKNTLEEIVKVLVHK